MTGHCHYFDATYFCDRCGKSKLALVVANEVFCGGRREPPALAAGGGAVQEPSDEPSVVHADGTGERRAEFGG